VTEPQTRVVLTRLRIEVNDVLNGSVICVLKFATYKDQRSFILGLFRGNFVEQFEKEFSSSSIFIRATKLPDEVHTSNGVKLSDEEIFVLADLIRILIKRIKITVWMNYEDLQSFFHKDVDSVAPSTMRIIVDLSFPPVKSRLQPNPQSTPYLGNLLSLSVML